MKQLPRLTTPLLACVLLPGFLIPSAVPGAPFVRGDTDADAELTLTDGVRILGFLFGGQPNSLDCVAAADADASDEIEITDGVYLLSYLFLGGSPPPAPFPDCGPAPTEELSCDSYPPCGGPPGDCLDSATVAQLAAESTPTSTCVPPSEAQVLTLQLSFCNDSGCPSPEGGEPAPGCSVAITVSEATVNPNARQLSMSLVGSITDTPLKIVDIRGSTADCLTSLTLAGTAVIQLLGEENGSTFVITGLEDAVIEGVDLSLTATGGELCSLLAGASALFLDNITEQVEASINENLDPIVAALSNVNLCLPAE